MVRPSSDATPPRRRIRRVLSSPSIARQYRRRPSSRCGARRRIPESGPSARAERRVATLAQLFSRSCPPSRRGRRRPGKLPLKYRRRARPQAFKADEGASDQLAPGGRIDRNPGDRRELNSLRSVRCTPLAAVGRVLPKRHREPVGELPQAVPSQCHEDFRRPGSIRLERRCGCARRESRHRAAATFAQDHSLGLAILGVESIRMS